VGFVSSVVEGSRAEVVNRGLEMAAVLAGKSPVAVQGTKEVLNFSRDHSTEDGLRYVGVWNAAMVQSVDVKEAMMAGRKRKTPRFEKL